MRVKVIKQLCATALIIFCSIVGYAQTSPEDIVIVEPEQAAIDSLQSLISEYTPESVKVKIYYDIAAKYTNYDSILKYNLLSLKTEEELKRKNDQLLHDEEKRKLLTYISALAGALIVVSFIVFFITRILKIKKKANTALSEQNGILISQKAEIEAQRDEIEAQRDEIEIQKNLISDQMCEVEKVNNQLLASINYAQRIQRASLSSDEEMNRNFNESFIYYQPKDIVSGDYYITEKYGPYSVMITADCTGHGIPGAFLSILGIAAIKEYMRTEEDAENPGVVLDRIRSFIKSTINSHSESRLNDGMDMSICSFNFEKMTLTYAIANQKVLLIRNGEIIALKGDNMPVGRCSYENGDFQTQSIKIELGDMVYMFSDGIQDQFGIIEGNDHPRKFGSRRLADNLATISSLPVHQQLEVITQTINTWRGSYPQTDDQTLVGIRI
ncbi:MAG: SpoIIE family protein phosphatase [Bacteroidales bacterium]|nr:SpoIIE family protein phosphatase [Bacteroidales bacterium]MBR4214960.1 SpoIIE family protein phosphatase [Bacteroidales bacterium]